MSNGLIRQNKLVSEFKLDPSNQIKSVSLFYDKKELLAVELDDQSPLSHFVDDDKIKEIIEKIVSEEQKTGATPVRPSQPPTGFSEKSPSSNHLDRIYGHNVSKSQLKPAEPTDSVRKMQKSALQTSNDKIETTNPKPDKAEIIAVSPEVSPQKTASKTEISKPIEGEAHTHTHEEGKEDEEALRNKGKKKSTADPMPQKVGAPTEHAEGGEHKADP